MAILPLGNEVGSLSMLTAGTIRRKVGAAPRRGFTLIELMVTLAVLAIIVGIAMPAFRGLMNANRLTAQANELIGAMQLARTEAIKRNARVSFCGSSDGTTCVQDSGAWSQWLVMVDADNSIVQVGQVREPAMVNSATPRITFQPDGLARTSAGLLFAGTVDVCLPVTSPSQNLRRISIASGSRTSIAQVNNSGACP